MKERPPLPDGSLFLGILVVESVVIGFLTVPLDLSLDAHLFRDPAELLGIQYLVTYGYRVNVDFGYPYGLLVPLIQRIWCSIVGANPLSIEQIALILNATSAAALAKIAINLRTSRSGKLLIVVALPFAALWPISLPHLEAALMLLALEQQSRGRYANALAFATAAVIAKPVMGYFYGLLVISIASFRLYRQGNFGARALAHLLFPSACAALILISLIGLRFGLWSSVTSLLPLRGANNYRLMNLGFFTGRGRLFWYFPNVRLGYYLGTVAAFWLLGTAWLLWSGVAALLALSETIDLESDRARTLEFVLTCAVLHVLFVIFFYGQAGSWSYYAYILVAGLAATSACVRNSRSALALLTAVAVLGNSGLMRESLYGWERTSQGFDGLWASNAERSEWQSVLGFVSGHRATLLATFSGGELLSPLLEPPTCLFLTPGTSVPAEIKRKANQIEGSEFVIVSTASDSSMQQILEWNPTMRTAIQNLRLLRPGAYFQVYGHNERPH